MTNKCRTCAVMILNPNAKNLFDQDDNEILNDIETLTGIRLKDDQHMPRHICTCCHLDLYHSIAFRERCLKTEHFLQAAKPKPKMGDPLNTTHTEPESSNEIPKKLQNATTAQLENLILNTPDTENLSKPYQEIRILRNCKQKTNTPKPDKTRQKTCSNDNSPTNMHTTTIQSDMKDTDDNESSDTTALGSPSKCAKNPSNSMSDINEFSDFEETELFQEVALDKVASSPSSPVVSSALPSQPAQDKDSMVGKRQYRKSKVNNVKPPANPKVFICDLCGHQSSSPKNLDIHILRHKGEKNFECAECGIKHYSKYLLQLHIRVKHQGEMPYLCKFCDQRFYSASTRQRHEQVRHIRSWSYECKICGKKYNTKSCLNKHEFLHTGLRPYRCDLCNVAFPRKPGLRIHCRTKQHQKRASEALNGQINDIKEVAISDNTIVFPDSIIVALDV
ncbi:PREDICTED: transcription factor Ouib-like [Drosophila arizonae]|uniref:Transcription factor Ouib-like n=1 Tax=Drosophila arizonae TaxID=7263 RepID=A0ABM1PXX6_DROAR|nr:PREDICTED: transcription factor Ouib-like [Drosophila arizonae]